MVFIYRCGIGCIIYFISQIAFAQVINFPNTNTVPTTSGTPAKLIGVTSIDTANRAANVVIDARDKFGNKIRVFKAASFNPLKIRQFVTTCVRNPVACVAASAISTALIYYGYTIKPDGMIVLPGNSGSYPTCVEKTVPYASGGSIFANGPMPCGKPPVNGKYLVYSALEPLPASPYLVSTVKLNGAYYLPSGTGYSGVNYQNWYSSEPKLDTAEIAITDQALEDIAIANPKNIQITNGIYPDIFNPVEINETVDPTKIPTTPEPDPANSDQSNDESQYEEMVDMNAVPESTVDISKYFSFGSGWLPKSCPAIKQLANIHGQAFYFDYSNLCGLITSYVRPFIRFIAVMSFLAIVLGGARD